MKVKISTPSAINQVVITIETLPELALLTKFFGDLGHAEEITFGLAPGTTYEMYTSLYEQYEKYENISGLKALPDIVVKDQK